MRIPNKKTNRIVQIETTTVCDLDCSSCTRALAQSPKLHMPLELFEQAVVASKEWILRENGTLALFGGNPCLWKHFDDGLRILRSHLPAKNCGLWSNNIFDKGPLIREHLGREAMYNLVAHGKPEAYDKIKRELPWAPVHSRNQGTKHASLFVAPQDFLSEDEIWRRQASCSYDIEWSAIIMLKAPDWTDIEGFSCEIAGTHSRLNVLAGKIPQSLGIPIVPGWLDCTLDQVKHQYDFACRRCSGLLNLDGVPDLGPEKRDQFSRSNEHLVPLTVSKSRRIEMVDSIPGHDHHLPIKYL